jgi:hypothetical protein
VLEWVDGVPRQRTGRPPRHEWASMFYELQQRPGRWAIVLAGVEPATRAYDDARLLRGWAARNGVCVEAHIRTNPQGGRDLYARIPTDAQVSSSSNPQGLSETIDA